ncbi:MAG: sigma-70 family RNA polymerase sigma factor, partial [Spirosomataceae bacterium]
METIIKKTLSELPPKCRVVFTLSRMEGKKNQEIADLLGMSINTVKKQKQKALELLRLRLTPELLSFLLILPAL